MPPGPTLLAGLGILAFYLLTERLGMVPARFEALQHLPLFAVVFQIVDKGPAFVFGAFIYHTIRQLALVNTINSNYVRIDLFNLGPSRAFSKLTASTAVGRVIGMVGWMSLNPDLLADPMSLGFAGLFTAMAVGVFVWPLWGGHRLMQAEKERALHDIALHFEAAFEALEVRIREGDHAAVAMLNGTIASLDIRHRRIRDIPTWPWRPEMARIVLTAIALPLMLMVIQFFVLRALNQ
jgi:hypothetical protein